MNYRLRSKILKKGSELAICHHWGCLQQEVKIRLMAPKFLSLLSSKRTLEVINLFLTIIKQSNKHSTAINRQIRQFNSVKSPEVTSCTLAIFCFCHWCHVQWERWCLLPAHRKIELNQTHKIITNHKWKIINYYQ